MSSASGVPIKSLLGLAIAFAIGFACRAFGIPSPAPPVLVGALLVVAMTTGYLLVDRLMARPAVHAVDCGGPSGLTAPDAAVGSRVLEPSDIRGIRTPSSAHTAVRLLTSRVIRALALLGLCAAYLQGGLQKIMDFPGAVAEAQHFDLPLAPAAAIATIVTELTGCLLILSGYYRWIGALWLVFPVWIYIFAVFKPVINGTPGVSTLTKPGAISSVTHRPPIQRPSATPCIGLVRRHGTITTTSGSAARFIRSPRCETARGWALRVHHRGRVNRRIGT